MLSKDPRDYTIIIQRSQFIEFNEDGDKEIYYGKPQKTFWLKSKNGKHSQRYSVHSAPQWVMQIYNKIKQNNDEFTIEHN